MALSKASLLSLPLVVVISSCGGGGSSDTATAPRAVTAPTPPANETEPELEPVVVIEPEPETEPEPVDEGIMSLVMPSLRPGDAVPPHQKIQSSHSPSSREEEPSGVFDFGGWSVPYFFGVGRTAFNSNQLTLYSLIQYDKIPDHFPYRSSTILDQGLTATYSRSDGFRGLYFTNENRDSFIPDRAIISDVSFVLSTPQVGNSFTISDFVIGKNRPIIIEGSGFSGSFGFRFHEEEFNQVINRNHNYFFNVKSDNYPRIEEFIASGKDPTIEEVPVDEFGIYTWQIYGRLSSLYNEDGVPRVVAGSLHANFKTGIINGVFAAEPE